jgi:hypothetical protein
VLLTRTRFASSSPKNIIYILDALNQMDKRMKK